MTIFEQTQTYKDILSKESTGVITIPFHVKTDIDVTNENLDILVQEELDEYMVKINEVKKFMPEFPVDPIIKDKIRERIFMFIGGKLLKLQFANVTKDTMLVIADEIEKHPDFAEWMVS